MPEYDPTCGPPAWYDWNGTRFYRIQSGYYQSREGSGYRRMHSVVWEAFNGRRVQRGFVVHHRNENRGDNRPENLELMSKAAHNRHHQWGSVRDAGCRARIRQGVLDSWGKRGTRTFTCDECGNDFQTRSTRTTVLCCSKLCASRRRKRLARRDR